MSKGNSLGDWLIGNIVDFSAEKFLEFMKLAFDNSDGIPGGALGLTGYHENIVDFEAVYVFETENKLVQVTATFKDGAMTILPGGANKWDLKVRFKDVSALWKFIFSGGNDIVGSLLTNDVQVYGNLNYLYKFGFMAKDLVFQRLGRKISFA